MKSKFLRMIAMILILASLLSMFGVFSYAAEGDDTADGETEEGETNDALAAVKEEFPDFELLYQRNFEEGWEIQNGFSWVDRGSFIDVDYERNFDYSYNYFFRFTVGSKDNSYLELDFNNGKKVGSVLEFDIMSDDYCNIRGLMHFGTLGAPSQNRENPQMLTILDGKVYFFDDGHGSNNYGDADGDGNADSAKKPNQVAFDISEEWMHVAIVFDYTLGNEYDPETGEVIDYDPNNFLCSIYFAPKEEYERTGEMQLYDTRVLKGKETGGGKGISMVRINTSGEPEENFDTSVCFDNIVAYNGANKYGLATFEMGVGMKVDENYTKTVEILGGSSTVTESDYLNQGIAMKVNVDYMRFAGQRTAIMTDDAGEAYGAPIEKDGVVYVPLLPILDALNYPYYVHKDGNFVDISTGESSSYISIGKDSATVGGVRTMLNTPPAHITDENGNEFIAIDIKDIDLLIPGWFYDYDELGLIVIAKQKDLIDRDRNLGTMMDLMKDFVFDYVSADRLYDDVKNNTGFDHPYLFGNQDKFDELIVALNAEEGDEGYDAILTAGVQRMVDVAEWYYSCYAKRDSNGGYDEYVGIMTEQELLDRHGLGGYDSYCLEQPYLRDWFLEVDGEMTQIWKSAYGYDPEGGRNNFSANRANFLMYLGLGWMLTKEVKYLLCAYDIALKFGDWDHWGPGHFLNCADAAGPFALYYDWCYDGIVALHNGTGDLDGDGVADFDISGITNFDKYDVKVMEDILYEKGVYEGYISSNDILTEYLSPIVGTGGSFYHDRANNWNAVCSAGMTMASLAILDSTDPTHRDNAAWLMSDNIEHLAKYGMGQYAPEGAYIESPGYWNYGTNNFFEMCMALDSAAGTNYGLMDCWGIDTTCYFAMHTESSDFRTFNYHDGAMSSQDSSLFFYAAHYFNDKNISGARMAHITNGKSFQLWDLFYYPTGNSGEGFEVELDYYSKALDLYCARSSWDKGATFIGMMGGNNNVTHGQLDAGSFVYHNMGTVWFIDLGTENYNCEGFWPNATRFRYYVMKPEGNNTMALGSDPETLPYGQLLNSIAASTAFDTNEFGSYVTYNMTPTLGGLATYWNRGMLMTNDRKTTVIQDDVVLNGAQTMYWFGHYSNRYVSEVKISDDGRTAYMSYTDSNKDVRMLRVSLISDKTSLKFEIMDAYTFLHTPDGKPSESIPANPEYTYPPEFATTHGNKVPENDRSRYSKLVVKSVNAISFKMAVVLEEIDPNSIGSTQEPEVAYTWTDMSTWTPVEDSTPVIDVVDKTRGNAKLSTMPGNMARAKSYFEGGTAFTSNFEYFYSTMTDVYYVIRSFETEGDLLSRYQTQCDQFEEYKSVYDKYIGCISNNSSSRDGVLNSVLGF